MPGKLDKLKAANLQALEDLESVQKTQKSKTKAKKKCESLADALQLDFKDNEEAILDLCIDRGSGHMGPEIEQLLKRKCHLQAQRGDVEEAAKTLFRAQGLSFLHAAQMQLHKRIVKQAEANCNGKEEKDMFEEEEEISSEEIQKRILRLQSRPLAEDQVTKVVESLPSEWKVVQINAQPFLQVRFY